MKIHLAKVKKMDELHGKKLGFVNSEFVKTCDKLVIGLNYISCTTDQTS